MLAEMFDDGRGTDENMQVALNRCDGAARNGYQSATIKLEKYLLCG